jgi:hypothetical protein
MTIAVCDSGATNSPHLLRGVSWLTSHQATGTVGDWQIYNTDLHPGAEPFPQYSISSIPDETTTPIFSIRFPLVI